MMASQTISPAEAASQTQRHPDRASTTPVARNKGRLHQEYRPSDVSDPVLKGIASIMTLESNIPVFRSR